MQNRWIRPLYVVSLFVATGIAFFGFSSDAFAQPAQKLGDMTNNVYNSLISLQFFLSLLSYILGVFFSITGLQMLRAYVDDPGRNPAQGSLLRLGAAAFFIFAPTAADALVRTLGVTGGVGGNDIVGEGGGVTVQGGDFNADGVDAALGRFVIDFGGPFLENLLPFMAYIAGVIFMLVGLKRLALANGDGPQAPGGMGTMGTFLVAAALMAFGYVMFVLQGSLFGTTDLYVNQVFVTQGDNAALVERAERTLWGVFMFLRIVGYVSVLRGLFMLRAVAEGGNVSMMAVGTHMVAGALLANSGAFVNAVQHTFIADEADFVFQSL
jgi:hypothetical protein